MRNLLRPLQLACTLACMLLLSAVLLQCQVHHLCFDDIWVSGSISAQACSCARAGLIVRERNWMEVFPWARWGGNDALPPFVLGQTFMPSELLLKQVRQPLHCPTLASYAHPACCGSTALAHCSSCNMPGGMQLPIERLGLLQPCNQVVTCCGWDCSEQSCSSELRFSDLAPYCAFNAARMRACVGRDAAAAEAERARPDRGHGAPRHRHRRDRG